MRRLRFFAVLLTGLLLVAGRVEPTHGQQPDSPPSSAGDQQVPAADVDPDAFGFSVSGYAASLGVKLRGLLGSRSAVDQVRDIVDPAALQYTYYRSALRVLSSWTDSSSLAGLVRVNQPLKPGFVNFFILEHNHLAAKAPSLACNCSYVPGSWSIVCDGLFLANAQRLLESGFKPGVKPADEPKAAADDDKTRDDLDEQIKGMFREFLFEWMIAHELGHLANNHTVNDLARSWTFGAGIPVGLAAEKEADEFYISRMQHNQQRQFGAWIGLSNVVTRLYAQAIQKQRPEAEIKAQIDKHGSRFVFDTELGIDVKYVSDKHPPLLLRALNLANLVIARYPQMYDSTGYFDRIRDRIKPEKSDKPDTPELCLTDVVSNDNDSSEVQVLAKQLDILLVQSAPAAWTQAAIDKLRSRLPDQKDPQIRTLSSLALDLSQALAQPDAAQAKTAIDAVEAASAAMSEPYTTTLRLLVLVARARAGLLPDSISIGDAIQSGEDQINALVNLGVTDLSKPHERAEALRQLLQIAVARGKKRDGRVDAVISNILGEVLNLSEIGDMDKQALLQILEADFSAAGQRDVSAEQTRSSTNAAIRVAELADRHGWPLIEVNYLASQLALMERMTPKPSRALMISYFNLGRQLRFVGLLDTAPAMFQRAVNAADAFLLSPDATVEDKNQVALQRLTFLNNLGWSLLTVRKFPEALVPLNAAREGRLKQHAGRTVCDKAHREDVELATVNQNLADASLAAGDFDKAAQYAHEARQCRIEMDIKSKIIESSKTEGYALIYRGKKDEGVALLQEYSTAIRQLLDDDVLPAGDPFLSGAIVNGAFVPLEQFVQFADKNRPIQIPTPPAATDNPKEKQ